MNDMTDSLDFLISTLLAEQTRYQDVQIPQAVQEKKCLLRSLMNVRPPHHIADDFLRVQDIYLLSELASTNITNAENIPPVRTNPKLTIWQGDITTLKVDAIVNAANSQMLGCFAPCHGCIDNAIHSASGIQLRLECYRIMQSQGFAEPTGTAKITRAYNLPCRYVLHTVGPIITGELTEKDCKYLADCYRSCLELAEKKGLKSIAFCCVSTGEYRFPHDAAAEIAIKTVSKLFRARFHTGKGDF